MFDDRDPAGVPSPSFYYRHGLAVLRAVREAPSWMDWDDRTEAWVAPGYRLPDLRAWAADRGVLEGGAGPDELDAPFFDPRRPREYQREALERWRAAEGRGTVVLPTGSGKSFVALLAIQDVGAGACVVAPTRALLGQWFNQLADAFGPERVGAFYGDEKDPRPITVTTYHSAFTLQERFGERFDLLVLDEAHHLADTAAGEESAWHDALRIAPARRRLGLTATYPDGRDEGLRRLLGPVVYRRSVGEMVDAELADFALERRFVSLTADERERYDRATSTYEGFVDEKDFRARYGDDDWWKVFMAATRSSPRARRAFRAFRERERIVALSERKLAEAGRLLRLHAGERAVLFCGSTDAAEAVSRRFAVPLITGHTPASERKRILDWIEEGAVRAVSTVRVLDEGWDVPSAKLGLILGDTTRGGPRQHRQRLGRILRRQGERVASLWEIVVADTHEFFASQKRRAGAARMRDRQLGLGL
ncbi:MAG: DEAD/DEAH box helicase family protein [Gemmatimonadota bacterium]|jgi:superfamily II DNA or RNA helicase